MVTINAAESNRAVLYLLDEVTWGATPGSGVVRTQRITKSSIVLRKDTEVSKEIRADRQVSSIIEVGAYTEGDIDFELSAGGQDEFWKHFLLSSWSESMTYFLLQGSSVSVASTSTISLAGADYRNYINTDYIKLEGFTTVSNNGYWLVTGKAFTSGNTVITVSGTPLTIEAGTAFTKILDASDVLLKSTTTAFTSGNTVNGGGANSFAGKSIVPGQTVYIEGLGKGSGSIVCGATDPTEGETFTIDDGVSSVVFEIRTNQALVANGNVYVAYSGTPATLAAAINAAVNTQFAKRTLRVSSTVATGTVTLTNHRGAGGAITSSSALSLTVTSFSGGSSTKSGFFTVATVPNDDTFTTVETLTDDANTGTLAVIIKGSHIRNPGVPSAITKQSFSAETGFTDVNKQFGHDGLRTGNFKMTVKAKALVEGMFGLMGRATVTRNNPVLGDGTVYTVLDALPQEPLNATANVGLISKDGTVIQKALMSIELEGDSKLRQQPAVGSRFPAGVGYGRLTVKGKIEAYFDDFSFFNDYNNHTTTSLSFSFEDADNHWYKFSLPSVKFLTDPVSPEGIDQDVMEMIDFQAKRDPTLKTTMMIDRTSSVWPMSAVA
mgnify:CR=1 FL=1